MAGCLLRLLGGAWLNGAISVSVKAFRIPKSGEPNFRELEPNFRVAPTARCEGRGVNPMAASGLPGSRLDDIGRHRCDANLVAAVVGMGRVVRERVLMPQPGIGLVQEFIQCSRLILHVHLGVQYRTILGAKLFGGKISAEGKDFYLEAVGVQIIRLVLPVGDQQNAALVGAALSYFIQRHIQCAQ